MSGKLGITVPLLDVPLADHRAWLRRIVDLGYSDCWTMETGGFDAFSPLLLAAAWAPELRLGTAIASVFARGPALLAQQAAALADAAPGRFVLGIGSSSEPMVRGWNDIPFENPFARVRDTLRFLRRAFTGERIDETSESFTCRGFQLDRAPSPQPPIYLAALRRDMLRLAGREADGVLLSLVGPEDLPQILRTVHEGSQGRPREVVLRIGVLPTEDAALARAHCRRTIAAYLTLPAYAAMHGWLGRSELLAPIQRAWQAGDRKAAAAAVPDALVDALFVHGPAASCCEQIEVFREAGVTLPVISIMPFGGEPDALRRVVRELAC